MDVHGQVLKDVVGAQASRVLLPVCVLEESLDAGLEFLVVDAQLPVNHGNDLVVVLHSKEHILHTVQDVPIRGDLELLYCFFKGMGFVVVASLQQDVDAGHEYQIGKAVAYEVDQVALVVVDSLLGDLQEQVRNGEVFVDACHAHCLLDFV